MLVIMLIAKGAEATITKENETITKERIKKGYRLDELDKKLRKRRTASEVKLIREARRCGVNVPQIVDTGTNTITMEFIDGNKIKDILDKTSFPEICGKIGEAVAKLHNYDIIHGDLTTSNMIVTKAERIINLHSDHKKELGHTFSLWFIDFGLGFISKRDEDKATDLRLLHGALKSTHFDVLETAWDVIVESYKKHYAGSGEVIKALSAVEKRGRYKER